MLCDDENSKHEVYINESNYYKNEREREIIAKSSEMLSSDLENQLNRVVSQKVSTLHGLNIVQSL